jgi:hypothetical protein
LGSHLGKTGSGNQSWRQGGIVRKNQLVRVSALAKTHDRVHALVERQDGVDTEAVHAQIGPRAINSSR